MSDTNEKKPTLNREPISPDQLQEEKNNLKKNERIVEISPGDNRKLQRMQD